MATNFPASLDSLTNPTSSDSLNSPSHSAQHANVNDAVEALQAKVGVDSSAVTTSLDYKVAQLESDVAGFTSGKILQVVSNTKTDTFSVSLAAGNVADITGLSATITPTSATSKILAIVNVTAGSTRSNGKGNATFVLKRDATQIGIGDASSNRFRASATQLSWNLSDGSSRANVAWNYLDSPATTSATTYQVEIANAFNAGTTETLYVNRSETDTDYFGLPRSVSTITLLEVSA